MVNFISFFFIKQYDKRKKTSGSREALIAYYFHQMKETNPNVTIRNQKFAQNTAYFTSARSGAELPPLP